MSAPQLQRLQDALAEAARDPDNNQATVRASDLRYLLSQYDAKLDYCKQRQARALAWHGRYAIVKTENNALRRKPDNQDLKNMALLIARLARALEKASPDSDLPAKAVDYLRRHDLTGSPLR